MLEMLSAMRADIRWNVVDRGRGRPFYIASAILKILLYPRIQAVLLFRLAHLFYGLGLTPVAYLLQAVSLAISGAEIHPAARIGPGFCLVHSNGVVIGDSAVIGGPFFCLHGVTIGDSGKGDGQPVLGDFVRASAGAKILGAICIGDHAVIGANAVVLIDVPAGATAVGVPARVLEGREIARSTEDRPTTVS
jgi:serine O-acetyltransferase